MPVNIYKCFIYFFLLLLCMYGCNKTPNEYYNEGMEYYKKEEDENAIKCFNKAIELDSSFFNAYLYLGKTYYINYQDDLVVKTLSKAKEIGKHKDVFRILGNAYNDMDKIDNAIETYKEGLKYFPEDDLIIYDLASSYFEKKYFNESLQLLNSLVTITPDSFDVYYLIGRNLHSLNDYQGAIKYFKTAISKAPSKDFLYYDLSLAYLKIYQIDSALICASKTVELDNLDERNLFLLSSIFLFNDKQDSSDYYFEQLKDLLISDFRVYNEELRPEPDY